VANGTDSGPKALPGSFSLPLRAQRTRASPARIRHMLVVNLRDTFGREAWHG
jgi:hypothetical protein